MVSTTVASIRGLGFGGKRTRFGLYGVEGFLRDGENGFQVERSPEAIACALERLLLLTPEDRSLLGANARLSVQRYGLGEFSNAWRSFYTNRVFS